MDKHEALKNTTKCKGTKCPIKDKCCRYTTDKAAEIFADMPCQWYDDGKTFSCAVFWGENADQIFNKLFSIVEGEERNDNLP